MLRIFFASFVVMNIMPLLPVVVSMTGHMQPAARSKLLTKALLMGAAVSAGLVVGGPLLFSYIDITLHDLRIGGGIILLVFVTYDLLFSTSQRKQQDMGEEVGIIPLGVPILAGPATFATLLVMSKAHGRTAVLAVLAANVLINWVLAQNAHRLLALLGESLTQALGKLYSLFLAAIAVSMMRNGIAGVIQDLRTPG